jgi:hypothetical protein
MANALAWLRHHPGIMVLIAALVAGQVLQGVLRARVEESVPRGQFPVVAASVLAVALVLAIVAIVLRVRLGGQMLASVRASTLSLPAPESLPPRYVVADPPRQVVGGMLTLVDIGLLLLIQSTLRAPALSIVDDYLTRPRANLAYVVVIVLVALVLLIKLSRTGGPVLVLLLWWGLDRVVPTAGFLGASPTLRPVPAPAPPARGTSLEPTVLASEPRHDGTLVAPLTTIRAAATDLEPTVVAPETRRDTRHDATIVAPLSTLHARTSDLEPTVVAPAKPQAEDATVVAPEPRKEPESLEGQTIVTGRRPEPDAP